MPGRLGAKLEGLLSIHYALSANGGKVSDLTAAADFVAILFLTGAVSWATASLVVPDVAVLRPCVVEETLLQLEDF